MLRTACQNSGFRYIYCQPSPQQCPSAWLLMSRWVGSESMGFPLAPAFPTTHRGTPEFGSLQPSAAWNVLITPTPTVDTIHPHLAQRSRPAPLRRALFSFLPSTPSQLATLLQDAFSGLGEVTRWQMARAAGWLPDQHTHEPCVGWKRRHDEAAGLVRGLHAISAFLTHSAGSVSKHELGHETYFLQQERKGKKSVSLS